MTLSKTRIVLVDDHPIVRAGIRNLIEKAPDIAVVGEASDGVEALRLARELAPDVLLLDMEMPGLKGVEVAEQLKQAGSPVRILALSAYDDSQYILSLLAAGAAGYLTKEEVPETIIEAVRGVSRGEEGWVSRRVAAKMATWTHSEGSGKGALTHREIEVLKWVVDGKTNQEIGVTLGISEKTVEKHLEAVFKKLGVASRVEAAVLAVREGIV
jgi:DNA-binding NarL/FixJ family response regulator